MLIPYSGKSGINKFRSRSKAPIPLEAEGRGRNWRRDRDRNLVDGAFGAIRDYHSHYFTIWTSRTLKKCQKWPFWPLIFGLFQTPKVSFLALSGLYMTLIYDIRGKGGLYKWKIEFWKNYAELEFPLCGIGEFRIDFLLYNLMGMNFPVESFAINCPVL